ncbi:hypothetical protein Bca52824_026214 [Brassica carinata]|uniref:Uncharacterized protein n=1 Tax=Brassica carinata TaxID=52824 RepID=A0A8X7V9U5_BRACI|nr:hypothetical protein Bca52824_026214 [Brassica carinata]
MEFHEDGVVLLPTDFAVKDEMKDERVDRILDMIQRKHDWSNHVWGVEKVTSFRFEESEEEEGDEQAADTEIGESSHVAENFNGTDDVSRRNKRKHADRGAESRKKKVLCQLAASSKENIDTDMKKFLQGLVQASFMSFEEKFSDRLDKFETVVTDRLGNIEAEVTQLRTTLLLTELAGKNDQPSGPSKSKIQTGPSTSKKATVPTNEKAVKKRELNTDDLYVNLPPVNLSQSSAIDLHLAKAKDSLDWLEPPTSLKMSPRRFNDRDIELAGADDPDSCLVYVHAENFKKMQDWQDTRT